MASGAGGGARAGAAGHGGCCCGGGCCDCPKDFQKVLELKDAGLVVYRHTALTEERNNITGFLESSTKTTDDVFILLNTKSSKLTSAQYLLEIETTAPTTSCPRCRALTERVHDLLERAPNIEGRRDSGICNRCLMRDKCCHNCETILDKFISNRREPSEGTKASIRRWLSEIRHVLDDITDRTDRTVDRQRRERHYSGRRIRASSELDIDQASARTRRDSRHLDIIPLFRPRAVTFDERGQFVDDISRMFDIFGETTSRRHEHEHEHDARPRWWHDDDRTPATSHTAAAAGLGTRRSFSEESIPFGKVSKGEAGRRDRDYGESRRFLEGEYKKRGEGKDFIAADDIKSQRYRDHGEVGKTYARGDVHYEDLKTVGSRSLAPTRKGTRVDTSAVGERLVLIDDRKHDETESKWKVKDSSKREYDPKENSKKYREEQNQRYEDGIGKTKTDKSKLIQQDQQKLKSEKDKSAKDKSGREHKQKGEKELSTKDKGIKEQKQRAEKELSAKDKGGQEQKKKGENELNTKSKGRQEHKQKGEKEFSAKEKGGHEQKQKGEKELSTKSKGGQEHKQRGEKELSAKEKEGNEKKQKGEKELSAKEKGGQEQKQKGEKELSAKNKSAQEPKQKEKREKELSTKDKGGQEPKQKEKEEKEFSNKDKTTQVPTLKGEKELGTKDKSGQEQKPKGEKELDAKDKGGQEQKPKVEKELSTKDKSGQEQKQKGEKELDAKDKSGQEQKPKVEKELDAKDKGEQEQKLKIEKELDAKDKSGQEQKPKVEKELDAKDKGGQEPKQKEEKELRTRDKDRQEPTEKGEKELSTKDKSNQEQKQKEEKELYTKDKGGQEHKSKGEKELGTRDKDTPEPKQKGKKTLNIEDKSGQEQKQRQRGEKAIPPHLLPPDLKDKKDTADTKKKGKDEKELDSKAKEGPGKKNEDEKVTDTKKSGKGEKDTKDKDDKDPKQEEKDSKDKDNKKEKQDAITIIMEQRKKNPTIKDYTGPKERGARHRSMKDEDEDEEEDKKTGKGRKGRKPDKKQEEKEIFESKKKEEKEMAINKIRVRRASPDDLILQLVQLKKTVDIPRRPYIEIELKNINRMIRDHFDNKHETEEFAEACPFCLNSDCGLETLELLLRPPDPELAEVIIGTKVYKYRPPLSPRIKHPEEHQEQPSFVPLEFHATYQAENIVQLLPQKEDVSPPPPPPEEIKDDPKLSKKQGKQSKPQETEEVIPKGIMNYKLSDRSFIEKGWTKLPTEKVVRKLNVYRMRPAHPEFDWFSHNKRKRYMTYDSGERLAEFDDDGRGRWYYRNGRLALDYYDAEGLNAQQRFVVWSSGEADERGRARPYTVLATFDYLGNGIVFDHGGKIRLKYNQTEGIVLDRSIGPHSHWKWHSLNDPPLLAQVMIDTQEPHPDRRLAELGDSDSTPPPHRPDNDEMLAIEFDNFVRAKGEKLTRAFEPYQIRMKALKINEYFSLRVIDQATVYLLYRDGRTNLKLNLGMVLDHHEIVDTDLAELGEVPSEAERRPPRSPSLAALQRGVAAARRRAALDARRHPPPPAPTGAACLARGPPAAVPLGAPDACRCGRKPVGPNLYYDNRIF